jgi:ribosome-binding protein aMBF1 (putative translation factor)|tara:strand:- start:3312 stop:3521 length:210 start_codon:yes stop_codon:yes gene_type:complete
MNVNPAAKAYTSLGISDTMEKPKKSSMSTGLLSRNNKPKAGKKTKSEPLDRVRDYVSSIRKARKQITNG